MLKQDPDLLGLDVRQLKKWLSCHINGALYLTGAERWQEVQQDRPLAVICGSGYRSSASASLLAHHGHHNVTNVLGDMTA